ncbi:MAG: MBL fold metallo-hydrolase [Bacteroidales bacterium]|nr:MBL fold metallo-hydrolase [Lentimicrobiaceae bacterium]MDD5693964.1 MBL fold metallo-hydrolase [Bacteroidales bacterium]
MIIIKNLVFNPFQVNTYVLSDETRQCVIIDAACYSDRENRELDGYISRQDLTPVRLIYTHCHTDHILGNAFVTHRYHLEPEVHPAGKLFWEMAGEFSSVFGLSYDGTLKPTRFLEEGDEVAFGNSCLRVLYTPGHADGSICLWNEHDRFVIVGDVLFCESVGRADLPTGNFRVLEESILRKLYALPDETVVYPGHGPETTIGFEKMNNPYVRMD